MKRFIAVAFLFLSLAGFSRTKHMSNNNAYVRADVLFSDTVKIAVDVIVDTAGKAISATYQEEGSTSNDSKIVEAALRKARQTTFVRKPKIYTQRQVFIFVVVG